MNSNQIRLCGMLRRAYTLSAQVLCGDEADASLAEEVCGELGELLAHLDGGASDCEDVADLELQDVAVAITQLV